MYATHLNRPPSYAVLNPSAPISPILVWTAVAATALAVAATAEPVAGQANGIFINR